MKNGSSWVHEEFKFFTRKIIGFMIMFAGLLAAMLAKGFHWL
jgi:hypothetical protein